jgi:MoaA/NifB/PqqE/SkfB family radical SAM enzyme
LNAPARLVVVWRITEACDLDCWYCEYARRRGGRRSSSLADDVLLFGATLGQYAAEAGREVLVSWLGGEPLLWPPLIRVDRVLHAEYGLQLSATTNGTHLDAPGMCEHLARHYRELTISVDGPAALHNEGRGQIGLHAKLRAGVAALREAIAKEVHGPLLRANLVLIRSNLPTFENTCQELAEWGIAEITYNALGGHPPGPRYGDEHLRPSDLDALRMSLPAIRSHLAHRGVTVRGSTQYIDRLEQQARGHPWPIRDCRPGQDFLFIDERGRAAPCAFTAAGYGIPVAELHTAEDIAHLSRHYHEQQARSRLAACGDCLSTQVAGKFSL